MSVTLIPWIMFLLIFQMTEESPPTEIQDVQLIGGTQLLNAYLDRLFYCFNGRSTSLREIYGDVQPTTCNFETARYLLLSSLHETQVISFLLPDVDLICAGDTYVDRELLLEPASGSSLLRATPSAIASRILANRGSPATQVTVIEGESRSGKTVTLRKIQFDVVASDPTTWTVYVDVPHLLRALTDPFTVTNSEWIFTEIISAAVAHQHHPLFRHLLQINPKKVLFLLDGLDQIVGMSATSTAKIIKSLSDAGSPLVVTGSPQTLETLREVQLQFEKFVIPQMNFRETRDYVRNIWSSAVRLSVHAHRTTMRSERTISRRLDEYASTFAALVQRTPLPRTPQTLNVLSTWFNSVPSPGSCLNYVLQPTTEPRAILDVTLDPVKVYDAFVTTFRTHKLSQDISHILYGALALAQIVREVEQPAVARALINVIEIDVSAAEQRLRDRRQRYVFVNHVGGKLEFIHPGFRFYFAAHYAVSMIGESDNFDFFVSRIVREPRYAGIVEFIDNFPLIRPHSVRRTSPFAHRSNSEYAAMLDNFLSQGFTRMFVRCADELVAFNALSVLAPYLSDTQRVLLDDGAKTFGVKNLPDPLGTQRSATRLELLIGHRVATVFYQLMIIDQAVKLSQADYQHLMQYVITVPRIDINYLRALIMFGPGAEFQLDFHRLLYKAVAADTEFSWPIVSVLSRYVLDPSEIRVNDENLLHAAARSNNVPMLNFVVERLNFPIVHEGLVDVRVLELALDSNPTPLFTPAGWWEKMGYLVKQIDGQLLSTASHHRLRPVDDEFTIPRRDLQEKWLPFMLGGVPENIGETLDARTMTVRPLESAEIDRGVALMRLRPASAWGLSSQTLTLRRKFLVTQLRRHNPLISFTELMVHYKSLHPLSSADRTNYRLTITTLLRWERHDLTTEDRLRIFNTLIDNIANVDDFHDLRHIAGHGLITQNGANLDPELYRRIMRRLMGSAATAGGSVTRAVTVGDRLMLQSADMRHSGTAVRTVQVIRTILARSEGFANELLSECLSNRHRRQANRPCLFSWKDVEVFTDAKSPRKVSQLRVNSDNFLRTIANLEAVDPAKAAQLITLVRELTSGPLGLDIVTGRSRMLLRDVVPRGGFHALQHHRRLVDAIAQAVSDPFRPSVSRAVFSLPSRQAVMYGAAALPLVRALVKTLDVCLQQKNHSECLQMGGILGLSVVLPVSGHYAVQYTPWIIRSWINVALDALPSKTPDLIRENTKLLGRFGPRVGVGAIVVGLAGFGVAVDLYNIIQVSKMLVMCSNNPDSCPAKEKIDLAISLTFSCVSIVVTLSLLATGVGAMVGIAIGTALLLLEMLAIGINEVLYHKNKYATTTSENLRIFFRRIVWMSPPADVQALERRADWINALADHGWKLLNASDDSIVAYAVGIGNTAGDPAFSTINMRLPSNKNSENLSRVLPRVLDDQVVPVCLPKLQDFTPYNEIPQAVPTATFHCDNSFVLAHKSRWNRALNSSSTILYDLEHVSSGYVVGSTLLSNIYLLNNSSEDFSIFASVNTADTFILRSQYFRGKIHLHGQPKTIIDCSLVASEIIRFSWHSDTFRGRIDFDAVNPGFIQILMFTRSPPNLHFIGRSSKPDTLVCGFSRVPKAPQGPTVSVDASGGSSSSFDKIHDCKTTIVRPFTRVFGSSSPEATYTPYVKLSAGSVEAPEVVQAFILPVSSKFIVTFVDRPLLFSTIRVKFVRSTRELIWRLRYSIAAVMELTVVEYSSYSTQGTAGNCVFVDGYSHVTVDPVITPGDADEFEVEQFNLLATVNSTQLAEVQHQHAALVALQANFPVVMKFLEPTSGSAFIFGARTDDRFFIDNSTLFLHGSNGCDIYTLDRTSPERVWVDNEALDSAWDILVLPDSLCETLEASRGLEDQFAPGSMDNVEITCRNVEATFHVVLRDFLLDLRFQHLLVYWNDTMYVLLPRNTRENVESGEEVMLAVFFSFSQRVSLTLTGARDDLAVNGTVEDNPVVGYRSGLQDVIVTTKIFNAVSSAFVVLKDFFTDDQVSREWMDFRIFILGQGTNVMRILNSSVIRDLAVESDITDDGEFIEEYRVDVSEGNKTIVIEHNKNYTAIGKPRLGVLVIDGAEPKNVMSAASNVSLMLWIGGTSIHVKNWCLSSLHRLYRIEFTQSSTWAPLVVRDIVQLECTTENFVEKLREKLLAAQHQPDDDESRLIRCLGSILADFLAKRSMHQLLGFATVVDQVAYVHDNCPALLTQENLSSVALSAVKQYLENAMQSRKVEDWGPDMTEQTFLKNLSKINYSCWEIFKITLNNRSHETLKIFDDVHTFLPCVFVLNH